MTNEITEMVAAVEGTSYSKMQIDKTGQWIFVSGSRNSSYFLRAIPISNPNNFVNLYYSSSSGCYPEWVYDDNSETMYFIAQSGNNTGLFTATKAQRFADKIFRRTYMNKGYDENFITKTYDDSSYRNIYKFNSQFYENDTLNSSKILEYMFSFCDAEGEKEFRLTAFQNDSNYSELYTELKDSEAIEWLASDSTRMEKLYNLACYEYNYNNEKYRNFMTFLTKSCFLKLTNAKATSWTESDIPIKYSPYPYDYNRVRDLATNENGVFGICTNVYENFSSTGSPYFYIVQIADSRGKLVENVRKISLPNGKVVGSVNNNKKLIMKYSLMDSSGGELGYHHIYAADLDSGNVINCFDNVPNRNSLEVVSFSSAGDFLYYSAVRGTAVENGIVNIVTNEYNPLTIKRKMVAVYAF